jgi:hypothetical protein
MAPMIISAIHHRLTLGIITYPANDYRLPFDSTLACLMYHYRLHRTFRVLNLPLHNRGSTLLFELAAF